MSRGMDRETLYGHLQNRALVAALTNRAETHDLWKKLSDAAVALDEAGASEDVVAAAAGKRDHYNKIRARYDTLIEDSWNLGWQSVATITKYLDHVHDSKESLPEFARF